MRTDHRQREFRAQFLGTASMIEMSMGQPDFLEGDAVFSDDLKDDVHIAAGINDNTLFGILIEEDGAVLLERRDRNNARLQLSHIPCLLVRKIPLPIDRDRPQYNGGEKIRLFRCRIAFKNNNKIQ